MIDIAIQIVNYKTKKYLIKCLETVILDAESSGLSYRIVIVDNNSGDDLSDIPSRFINVHIDVFLSKENRGFGAGHNLLAQKVNARYRLLLNPDIEFIEKNTIKRLYDHIESDDKIAVVGPRLNMKDGAVQPYDHAELDGIYAKIVLSIGQSYWKVQNKIIKSAWVSGAVFMTRSKVFDTFGGFDENFFLYKEEEDLCLRMRNSGYNIFYNPTIHVLHYGSVVASKSIFMSKSQEYYMKKHFCGITGIAVRFVNKCIDYVS